MFFADDLCYSPTFGLFYSRWFTGFSGEDEGEKLLGLPVVQWWDHGNPLKMLSGNGMNWVDLCSEAGMICLTAPKVPDTNIWKRYRITQTV